MRESSSEAVLGNDNDSPMITLLEIEKERELNRRV